MTTLSELAAKKAEVDALLQQHGKTAVANELAGFFAKYPKLEIRWTQYTPYFNDGDACVFSVHGIYVYPKPEGDDERDDSGHELGRLDFYFRHPEYLKGNEWITQELADEGRRVSDLLYANADALEAAFGDHMEIVASIDGVTADEYSHD